MFDDKNIMKTKQSLALRHVKGIMRNKRLHDGFAVNWSIGLVVLSATNWILQAITGADLSTLILATAFLCVCCALLSQSFLSKGFAELTNEKNKNIEQIK